MRVLLLSVSLFLVGELAQTCLAQEVRQIDTKKSSITIRVFKSGLFSAFAHDHEIVAPISEGHFSEVQPSVELKVRSGELRVMDREVSDKDRNTIQSTMLGPTVLDAEKFPEIKFRSTEIKRLTGDKWTIEGELTLHGQTHPVKVEVEGQEGHYRGRAVIAQKEFGMEPVRVAGGTVRVKNEVQVEFEVASGK
ncbi:MAG TPA: YceI family protein [Terriglobales bacterium]|jgi:polyisoprenoid-binding protein YceI|nr:YceI family protein [Terriglobales bacterium]